jgi:glutaredoxin
MTYYIKIISLKNCSYSDNALKLLEYYKIPFKKIDIDNNNKDLLKLNEINTFPQIYLKRKNRYGHLLLGGFTDLNEFINIFKNKNYNNIHVFNFMNKYKWSRIATIKLAKLITNN